MDKLKSFFLGTAKIAAAIFITIIALAIVGWGVYSFSTYREEVKNAPLGTPKVWSSINIGALGNSRLSLSTKWNDERMSYQFEMRGYPKSLAAQFESQHPYTIKEPGFTMTFLDKNGFKLFEEELPLSKTTRVVGNDGKPVGLAAKGNTYVSADSYRQAATWEVTWTF